MPAPQAVLRDIADKGLDPTRSHHRIGSDGRLAHSVSKEAPAHHAEEHRLDSHVDIVPVVSALADALTVPVVLVEEQIVTDEKSVVEGPPETEQASPVAKKGRGKKPAPESQV